MEESKPRSPDTEMRPGEKVLRKLIDDSAIWNFYAIDYCSPNKETIVYLESSREYRFRNAYNEIVNLRYIARVEITDSLYEFDPQKAAKKLFEEANRQRTEACNDARPR